jgi:hypothetical protein
VAAVIVEPTGIEEVSNNRIALVRKEYWFVVVLDVNCIYWSKMLLAFPEPARIVEKASLTPPRATYPCKLGGNATVL